MADNVSTPMSTRTSHQQQTQQSRDVISLAQPRPGQDRRHNEYIETPLRPLQAQSGTNTVPGHDRFNNGTTFNNNNIASHQHTSNAPPEIPKTAKPIRPSTIKLNSGTLSSLPTVHQQNHQHHPTRTRINLGLPQNLIGQQQNQTISRPQLIGTTNSNAVAVTTQPTSFKKEKLSLSLFNSNSNDRFSNNSGLGALLNDGTTILTSGTNIGGQNNVNSDSPNNVSCGDSADRGDSIICRECGRCKCQDCRSPRPLPSKWICNDKFLCSASSLVDYCSCLCCAKGLFYHLTKDYEMDNDVTCADQPCSCAPHKRCLRWSCLGLLALALPCLCCYWPLKGCLRICEIGYSGFVASHGCHCHHNQRLIGGGLNNGGGNNSTNSSITTMMTSSHHNSKTTAPEKRLLDSNSDC